MESFESRAQAIVKTLARIYSARGKGREAALLDSSDASFVQTGYDNLDGGTYFWSLVLRVPIEQYALLGDGQSVLEGSILDGLKPLIRTEAGNWVSEVVIAPVLDGGDSQLGLEGEQDGSPTFWRSGLLRAFISHCSSIKDKAHHLKEALLEEGIVGFVAHDDIEPTREWQAEIESALRTMDVLIALVTPDFASSRWCDQEVGIAIGRGKLVVPVRVGADPHGFLGKFQGLQAKGRKPTEVGTMVANILIKSEATSQRMVEALVHELRSSRSWARSKQIMDQIEKAPSITVDQLEGIKAALDNPEVKFANGVPGRVDALWKKFQ